MEQSAENGRSGIGRNLKKMSPLAISKWVCMSCTSIYVRQDKCVICALFSFNPALKNIITPVNFMTQGRGLVGLKNPSEGGGESSLELSTKSAKRKRRWFYKLSINWIRKRAERDPQACI